MLRMQVDTAVAARRRPMHSLSNASLAQPYPTLPLVQLTCTGRGSGVRFSTTLRCANPTAHLGCAWCQSYPGWEGLDRVNGRGSQAEGLGFLASSTDMWALWLWSPCSYLELCWCIACCGAKRRGDERRSGFLIKVFTIDHNRRPGQNAQHEQRQV